MQSQFGDDDKVLSDNNVDLKNLLLGELDFPLEETLQEDNLSIEEKPLSGELSGDDADPLSLMGTKSETMSGMDYVDINHDNIPDTIIFDTNHDRIIDAVYSDSNGGTMIDRYISDDDYDGKVDTDLYDKDRDFELEIND